MMEEVIRNDGIQEIANCIVVLFLFSAKRAVRALLVLLVASSAGSVTCHIPCCCEINYYQFGFIANEGVKLSEIIEVLHCA